MFVRLYVLRVFQPLFTGDSRDGERWHSTKVYGQHRIANVALTQYVSSTSTCLVSIRMNSFPSKCTTRFNLISRKSAKVNANDSAFPYITVLEVGSIKIGVVNSLVKIFQKTRVQQDDVIKRACVGNVCFMYKCEECCLLLTPHKSYVFICRLFFISSVEQRLGWRLMYVMIYWLNRFPLNHILLLSIHHLFHLSQAWKLFWDIWTFKKKFCVFLMCKLNLHINTWKHGIIGLFFQCFLFHEITETWQNTCFLSEALRKSKILTVVCFILMQVMI